MEIKINGLVVGKVEGVVEVNKRRLTSKCFSIVSSGGMKFINYMTTSFYRGQIRNKIITACSNTNCNFFEISSKVIKGGGGITPFLSIIKLDERLFIKFDIHPTEVMLWVSNDLSEWDPIGPILRGLSIGSISVTSEGDKVLLWYSLYVKHQELSYNGAWLVYHATLDIEKIKEVMYDK